MEYKTDKKNKIEEPKAKTTPDLAQLNKYINSTSEDYDSEDDPIPVVNFDNELKYEPGVKSVDIVFVIDCTGSMNPFFEGIKKWVRKLARDAEKCLSQYISDEEKLALGIVMYRDHPPQDKSFVTGTLQLTHDYSIFKKTVCDMKANGGGDQPEAVLDGLYEAIIGIKWRSDSEKFIYHILDAPPHGKEFSNMDDAFKNGCPCGKNWDEVLLKMREKEIDYTVIKLSPDIDRMILKFSEYIRVDVATPTIASDETISREQDNN
jgi:hypothetical protein